MSLGTLYGDVQTRSIFPAGLVKVFNLDIDVQEKGTAAHLAAFPRGKVPAFVGPHGYKLTESIAIIYYLIKLHDPESHLLGTNLKDQASVLRYLSWGTAELMASVTDVVGGLLGRVPYNKKVVDTGIEETNKYVAELEQRFAEYTYLVGERLTAADLFVATCFYRPVTMWFGKKWRSAHPVFMRWFNTVIKSEFLSGFFASIKFVDEPMQPPKPVKKEKKKDEQPAKKSEKAEKAEKAPAATEEPKKAKHPLEALGKPKIPLDEWKRTYSNEETREVALPYFWNTFYNDEDWSLWKVEYKYNDELTLTFMSNNLVGGFFNRLSGSTKYMFGCAVVYGENNNNGIVGAFVVRGQDFAPAFDVAPDWESYSFTKLDASKPEVRAFVDNMWAWDLPVEVNGEKKEIADGKVFK